MSGLLAQLTEVHPQLTQPRRLLASAFWLGREKIPRRGEKAQAAQARKGLLLSLQKQGLGEEEARLGKGFIGVSLLGTEPIRTVLLRGWTPDQLD